MAKIIAYSILAAALGQDQVDVTLESGTALRVLLSRALTPKQIFAIIDEAGNVRPHINIYVGAENIKWLSGLETVVQETDEIVLIPAVSGG